MTFKKWYLESFGGGEGDAADKYDSTDSTPNNDKLEVRVGSNVYSMPSDLFKNVGSDNKKEETYQSRAWMASLYAAYRLSTGKDLTAILDGASPTTDASRTAMLNELKRWYAAENNNTETLNVPANWNLVNFDELTGSKYSLQSGIQGFIGNGAIQVNGNDYATFVQANPHLQMGYSQTFGAPKVKNAAGEFVYRNADDTAYVDKDGNILTDYTGWTDLSGNPITFNTDNEQFETETGEPINTPGTPSPTSPRDDMFNQYYNDLFSLEEGTLGKKSLDNKTALYEKEATNALALANAGRQSQAMIQAQSVKAITDQIRSERLAQLRGGMSEAQLADRELQMLMSSVDQINGQAQMANQEATAAQFAKTTAKEQAFNDYMAEASVLGQSAAANYAGEAGDLLAQANKYVQDQAAKGITVSLQAALDAVSGYHAPTTTN